MRQIMLIFVLLGSGCQSFTTRPVNAPVPVDPTIELPMTQTILDLEKNALKQSAELTAQKQEAAACAVLDTFLKKYPERCEARLAYAELLFQMKESALARAQFEGFLEHSHEIKPDHARLLQVHGRLADIAQGLHDSYGEHLHKGIGLYYMARNYKGVGVGQTTFTAELLRTRAQVELSKAHELKPEEARPSWYLHGVFREQGQTTQAEYHLRLAQQYARQSGLTPTERRGIELAMRSLIAESSRR